MTPHLFYLGPGLLVQPFVPGLSLFGLEAALLLLLGQDRPEAGNLALQGGQLSVAIANFGEELISFR